MAQKSVDVSRLPKYCVVCGKEYGPDLTSHCTPGSLVAVLREGIFKKRTRYFTLDGEEISESELAKMKESQVGLFEKSKKPAAPAPKPSTPSAPAPGKPVSSPPAKAPEAGVGAPQPRSGPRWTREGRSFDEMVEEKAADAKRAGFEFTQVISIEQIAKSNWSAGNFRTYCLGGEPHAIAMLEDVPADCIPTLKRTIEGGACVFRAEYFAEPEYPIVHIGLGLPAKYDGPRVAFIVSEIVAKFVNADFQAWVESVEAKRYTLVDACLDGGQVIASGRTSLEPAIIAELVEAVDRANACLKTIPPGAQSFQAGAGRFYDQFPEPFIWSKNARQLR